MHQSVPCLEKKGFCKRVYPEPGVTPARPLRRTTSTARLMRVSLALLVADSLPTARGGYINNPYGEQGSRRQTCARLWR
eukprot:3279422-Prymnesium_polylepis.1